MRRSVLAEIEKAAADLAYQDDLTGLLNRRLLSRVIDRWWDAIVEDYQRLAVIMLDLDGFKEVNDTYGHMAGDAVLRATADVLRRSFRGDDVLVRYGGDEFVVLLLGASAADAVKLGERARAAMGSLAEDERVREAGAGTPVSFSIGVAALPGDGRDAEEVLAAADRRLFDDKRSRHPQRRVRGAWIAVAIAALAVAVTAAVVGLGRFGPPRADGLAGPTVEASPAREAELLAEISELRRQLEARREPARTPGDPEAERREVERLQATIGELEAELRRQGELAATPVAFRAVEPSPEAPTARAEPVQAAPTASGQPTRSAPAPDAATVSSSVAAQPVPPVLLRYDPPRYPEVAERMRREAAVELRVWVDANGRVTRVEPVGTPVGFGFDEAAREAARSAVYTPGSVGGRPVQMETTLTIRFTLDEPALTNEAASVR